MFLQIELLYMKKEKVVYRKKIIKKKHYLQSELEERRDHNMLSLSIKITNINYEKTFQQVFPVVKEKIMEIESPNMVLRLFQKLDDAALPVLQELMKRLSEDTKAGLVVLAMNLYSTKITDKLNEELQKHSYGQYLKMGCMSAGQERGQVYLWIDEIFVDYKKAVSELIPGIFGKTFSALAGTGENLEKKVIGILWTDKSKRKIIEMAMQTLDKYGFVMELTDIDIRNEKSESADVIVDDRNLKLSDKMEEDILDALAGYLKDKVENKDEDGMQLVIAGADKH